MKHSSPVSPLSSSVANSSLLLVMRVLFACALWSLTAPFLWAQESADDPSPASGTVTSSEPSEPGSVIPPEAKGDGDSWGYQKDTLDEEPSSEDSPDNSATSRPKIVKARLVGASGHRYVKSVSRIRRDSGRMEWSRQGDWLAFDKINDRGFRGLFLGTITGGSDRCLTCDSWDLRKSHVMAPTWHPSGRVLVAMVQGPAKKLDLNTWQLAGPDRALHSDLWAFTRDGRDAWQITQVVEQGGAVTDPSFSQEGNRLAWTQRVDNTVGGRWGSWEVRIGEFEIKRGLPRLGKVKRLNALPWPGFVSIHSFTDDDKGLWLTVTPAPGSADRGERRGFMTGIYDIESETFKPLPAGGNWDSLPSSIPRSKRRVWVSDRSIDRPRDAQLPWRGDLWLSSESGRRQERLTYFNDPKSDHYLNEAWIAGSSWSPDGDEILLHVLAPDDAGSIVEYLYRVKLDPVIGR